MDDREVLQHIDRLVEEEHALYRREEQGTAGDADRERLQSLQVALDRCWDLLRQRRARRDAGQNPDDAHERPAKTVENYRQ